MFNRKQRRKSKNTIKKEPTYTLRKSDIERIKKEQTSKAVDVAFTLLLGIPVMVLHDKNGFQPDQLEAFVSDILSLYDSYEKGYIELNDIRQTLKDETGVELDSVGCFTH